MRIAVAGGGIAGLTAAIALADRGFAVELFERSERLDDAGAGIQLSPNATTILQRLGVMADLADAAVEPEAVEIRDAMTGRLLTRVPLGAAARHRYGAPYLLIQRADLQASLLAAASRRGNIAVRLGMPVSDLQTEENRVVFRAGGEAFSAEVLVAADGVHSDIRANFFHYPGALASGRAAWRALLPSAEVPSLPLDVTRLWLGPGAHLVHYPIAAGRNVNIVVIGPASGSAGPPMARFGVEASAILAAVDAWSVWPIYTVDHLPSWVRGRVVLIGDSAHAMLPTAAQGGAQAIEDAFALATALLSRPADPEGQLLAYERRRKTRIARIIREARRNLRIYGLSGAPAALRNFALSALPPLSHLSRLDWLYGEAPTDKLFSRREQSLP